MIRKYGLLMLLFTSIGLVSKAQLADKATFFGGFNYQFVSLTPQGSPSPDRLPFYGLGLGMDYVLLHSNDQVSLGLNPNLNFSFVFSSAFGVSLLTETPVYLLARLGANSTPYNEQKFGIGAGIGLSYSYMLLQQNFFDQFGNPIGTFKLREGWVNPSAIVEINLKSRFSDYIFRFHWSLAQPTREIEELGNFPYRFGIAGLSIFYAF